MVICGTFTVHQRELSKTIATNLAGTSIWAGWQVGIHPESFLEKSTLVCSVMRHGREVVTGEGLAEEHTESHSNLPGLEQPVPGT